MSDATVYVVRWPELDRFQDLMYDLPEVPGPVRVFDGRPKADWWEPVPVYSDLPRLEAPDLWHVVGSATIAMSAEIAETLVAFLHPVGELLPLRFVGAEADFFALNILRDVDCLNPAAYAIDELRIETDFLEHRLPESGLFKVPQVDDVEIFYLERGDDEETLRAAIDEHGYRGLAFTPVWASDGSIGPINLLATL